MSSICYHSMEHASDVEINATNKTISINHIQIIKEMGNTPSSLATETCVAKRYTWTETFLKESKIPARILLTVNHVSTSLKWKMNPSGLVWNYYLCLIKINL